MSRNSCATRRRASVLMPRPSRFVSLPLVLSYLVLTASTRSTVSKRPTTAPCTLVGYERPAGGSSRHLFLFSNRQQGAHCHDPHGCFASLYDPYELFRHDRHHLQMRTWRDVARDTQALSLLLQQLFLRLLYAFSYTFRSSRFPSTASAILARREDIAL
jgi:hypothetical protein